MPDNKVNRSNWGLVGHMGRKEDYWKTDVDEHPVCNPSGDPSMSGIPSMCNSGIYLFFMARNDRENPHDKIEWYTKSSELVSTAMNNIMDKTLNGWEISRTLFDNADQDIIPFYVGISGTTKDGNLRTRYVKHNHNEVIDKWRVMMRARL